MATQAAPVNLKERIAALQQRNVSPSPTPRPASPSSAPAPNSAGLRDKIAKFEKKGGVPVPRGSFGLGAPPPGENAQQKRRGELYGNRIPSAARVASGGPPIGRPMSPVEPSRSFSMSAMAPVSDDSDTLHPSSPTSLPPSPVSPFLGLSVDHAHGKDPTPRATPFSAALDLAKQVASGAKAADSVESPLVASKSPMPVVKTEEVVATERPSIVVSLAEEVVSPVVEVRQDPVVEDPAPSSVPDSPLKLVETRDQPQRIDDTKVQVTTPETSIEPPHTQSTDSTPVIVLNAAEEDSTTTEPNTESIDAENITTPIPTTVVPQPEDAGKPATSSDGVGSTIVKSTNLVVNVDSPEASPIGPSTLANAAHDLGKLVANIQDMFPGQISPIITPPGAKPHRAPESAANSFGDSPRVISTVPQTPKEAKPSVLQDQKPTISIDKKDEEEMVKTQTQPPVVDEPTKAAVPTTLPPLQPSPSSARPTSMIETSSQRTSPPSGKMDYDHFPPTPDGHETSFGTVTAHKPSQSFSSTDQKPAFTAVVHKKTTEIPRLQPTTLQVMPTTPQTSKTGAPMLGEVLLSPGFGELTSLLQDAALMEQSLETGQLPGEEAKREEAAKLKRAEAEARIAPAKPVEEEKTKKVTTKRDSADSKSKSRNPMLRSKTWRKDDSGEVQANPPRSKSVLLPFRPTPQDTSSTSRQSLPPQRAAKEPSKGDVDDSSPRSPPKSPRGYFAGLRRFASSSRSSLTSGAHSRYSVSTSSEMSSEDSASLPTPPGAMGLESPDSGQTEMGWKGDVSWPAVSPKKASSAVSKAASFADKMWGRSRTRSTMSSRSEYDSIDRLANGSATKSAVTLLPQLETLSYEIDLPDLPSPPEHLVSPGRSASVYVASTSQFPPIYAAQPTSPVYTTTRLHAEEPLGPSSTYPQGFLPRRRTGGEGFLKPLDEGLFSAKPTSPVYTPHQPTAGFRLEEEEADSVISPPLPSPMMMHMQDLSSPGDTGSFLSTPGDGSFRDSWLSGDSTMDLDVSVGELRSALVDSFPSVPVPMPGGGGDGGSRMRPTLPLSSTVNGSFFESAPLLSSMAVGAEFLPARSATAMRSASVSRVSGERRR